MTLRFARNPAAVCCLLMVVNTVSPKAGVPPESRRFGSSGSPLVYVVMGDSTAAGVGAEYESGIAVATAMELGRKFQVVMSNLAISGARTRDVRQRQLATAEVLRPDVVLLSVGANDVIHLTPVARVRAELREIVRRLRDANPEVRIVITGSPDMGAPTRIPRVLRGVAACRTKQLNKMFEREVAALELVFAPIALHTGPQFRRDHTLFDTDRFHPNDRGYATWVPVLNEALAVALR